LCWRETYLFKYIVTCATIFRIAKLPGLRLLAEVDVSVVAFTSDVYDVFLMSDELAKKGWHLNPLQFPSG